MPGDRPIFFGSARDVPADWASATLPADSYDGLACEACGRPVSDDEREVCESGCDFCPECWSDLTSAAAPTEPEGGDG